MLKGNAIIGQSGGPTSVINASLAGIIRESLQQKAIERVLGMRFGIEGFMQGDVIDLGCQTPETIDGLRTTPSSALGSCRHKLQESDFPGDSGNAPAVQDPLLFPHRRQRYDGHHPSRRGLLPERGLRSHRRGRAQDGRQRSLRDRPYAGLRQRRPLRGSFRQTGRHARARHEAGGSVRDFPDGRPVGRLAAGRRRHGQARRTRTPRTSCSCRNGPSTATGSWPT